MIESLVLMYVFFDDRGDIKAIMPTPDNAHTSIFEVATFPLDDVKKFLTLEENTFNYYVKKIQRPTGNKYIISTKKSMINYTRTLDSYLTEVEENVSDPVLLLTHDKIKCQITIELDPVFKKTYQTSIKDGDDMPETVTNFFSAGPSTVYVTKKGSPYCMLSSFVFTPAALLDNETLHFPCDDAYNSISFYTKKLINGYKYQEHT